MTRLKRRILLWHYRLPTRSRHLFLPFLLPSRHPFPLRLLPPGHLFPPHLLRFRHLFVPRLLLSLRLLPRHQQTALLP